MLSKKKAIYMYKREISVLPRPAVLSRFLVSYGETLT